MKRLLSFLLATALVGQTAASLRAQDHSALSARIDNAISAKLTYDKVLPSPPTDDHEFLRRAYLDITGKIPTAVQVVAFLDDPNPGKRAKLIDQLVESPDFGRHFAVLWRNRLAKRDEANQQLELDAFTDWLARQFNDGAGWDKIVTEMIAAEGSVDTQPGGTFYIMNRDMRKIDPKKVVGTTVNLFLGIQMQCAECHNHPFVDTWKRTDFWGMLAFFDRVRDSGGLSGKPHFVTDAPQKQPKKGMEPAGPFGLVSIPSATEEGKFDGKVKAKFFEGAEPELGYTTAFREVFAKWLTAKENPYFARAAVNRTWAHFFGRGLVYPTEDMHENNPASHPELFAALSEDFASSGFNLKRLVRAICNSQAYQASSRPVPENKDQEEDSQFARMKVKAMSADVLFDALTRALGTDELSVMPPPPKTGNAKGPPVTQRALFLRVFDVAENEDDPGESGHGIPQFLRLMNGAAFNKSNPTVEHLLAQRLPREAAVEQLFLTALSRRPTAAEQTRFQLFLDGQRDVSQGYRSILWVLINSAEFVTIR